MDGEGIWVYYHDGVVEKIDLSLVLKTAESGCSALGINWGSRGKHTLPKVSPSFLGQTCISPPWNSKDWTEHKNRTIEFCVFFKTDPKD